MKAYRLVAALIVWAGLLLQYYLLITGQNGGSFAMRTTNFFSYFTIISNILAAIALTAPTVAPASPLGRYFAKPGVRTAIVLYATVTAITYVVILAAQWSPQGLAKLADSTLHHVMPALFLIDWLVFVPKGTLRWGSIPGWLALPFAYGLYSIVRGPMSGFYPYPFMDVPKLGMPAVLVNMGIVALLFVILASGFVLLDRVMKRRRA